MKTKSKETPAKPLGVIDPGSPAPAFRLTDQNGAVHQLEDYRGKWVVLYFYPRDDTPGCTREACQFRDSAPTFSRRDTVVLAVSPDDEASHARFAVKFGLAFPLLADPGAMTCQTYGVWREKNLYGHKSMGVVRTTYLIDPKGQVAHRWDKVSVEGHDQDVLTKLASVM